MTIHKEGIVSIVICLLFIALINAAAWYFFPEANTIRIGIYIFSAFLFLIILQFFRSPVFQVSGNDRQVLSPADGKVVVIEETDETEYFKDRRIQISIFMSPVNVHVNRNPVGGLVKYAKYHPGQFLVAWHPKSSLENERTTIVISQEGKFEILVRQIAGALARRIVMYLKEGQQVKQGDEFGFIKFGSRVDVFLPLGTEIKVGLNQAVKGGRTILAEIIF